MSLDNDQTYRAPIETELIRVNEQISQLLPQIASYESSLEQMRIQWVRERSTLEHLEYIKKQRMRFLKTYWSKVFRGMIREWWCTAIIETIFAGIYLLSFLGLLADGKISIRTYLFYLPVGIFCGPLAIVLVIFLFSSLVIMGFQNPIFKKKIQYYTTLVHDLHTNVENLEMKLSETKNSFDSLDNTRGQLKIQSRVLDANLPVSFSTDEDVDKSSQLIIDLKTILTLVQYKLPETQRLSNQFIDSLVARQQDFQLRKARAIRHQNQSYNVELIKKFLDELHPSDEVLMTRTIEIILEEGKTHPVSKTFIHQFLNAICTHVEGFQYVHLKEAIRCNSKPVTGESSLSAQIDALFASWVDTEDIEEVETVMKKTFKKSEESHDENEDDTGELDKEQEDSYICRACRQRRSHDEGDYKIAVCEKCLQHFDAHKIWNDYDDGIISDANLKTFDLLKYLHKSDE